MKALIITILIVISSFVCFDVYESKTHDVTNNSYTSQYFNNIEDMELKTLSVLNR